MSLKLARLYALSEKFKNELKQLVKIYLHSMG